MGLAQLPIGPMRCIKEDKLTFFEKVLSQDFNVHIGLYSGTSIATWR